MANLFKSIDTGGFICALRDFGLALRQFFATKSEMEAVIAEKDALIQDMEQSIILERKGYNAVPLVCGQPMVLIGYGTPQEGTVPFNWKQFDPKTGEGYNWNGLPSANGQIYLDIYNNDESSSTAKIYVAVSLYNAGDLVWRQC